MIDMFSYRHPERGPNRKVSVTLRVRYLDQDMAGIVQYPECLFKHSIDITHMLQHVEIRKQRLRPFIERKRNRPPFLE